jgi:demethylmenaquinone methyltransferase/2-methoxy-6-polyprenyl-1,4-benzoquinol methylase
MAKKDEARPSQGRHREQQVRRIFSEIAPRYDLLNHLLSLNVDRRWRRRAVGALGWEAKPDGSFLDACAGTFDLGLELANQPGFKGAVVASDFAAPMLLEGKEKIRERGIWPVCGDTLKLPFSDRTFHGAMVAFGVRNLADVEAGVGDLVRVLRPEGRLVILEFTEPPNPLLRRLYLVYFNRLLPVLGRIISGHPWAYRYLPESVREFPTPPELAGIMERAGLTDVRWDFLTGGIAALHVGRRR